MKRAKKVIWKRKRRATPDWIKKLWNNPLFTLEAVHERARLKLAELQQTNEQSSVTMSP